MLRVLDLFSGIGGFSLGLERTGGFRTDAFVEIEPYCQRVLRKHWPCVPIHSDIRHVGRADFGHIDVICGGFPCQDISEAGKGAGLAGGRSGLWSEFRRLIGEIRPRYAIVENVSALTFRGLLDVLGDLSEERYDAEWHCIQAADVGARHIRDRVWIVAVSDPTKLGLLQRGWQQFQANGEAKRNLRKRFDQPEPVRVAHGIPGRTHRLRALGNTVVPQIPELIGRAILEAERTSAR